MQFHRSSYIIAVFVCLLELSSRVSSDCVKSGQTYATGIFEDPGEDCSECDCKADGTFTCAPMSCDTPACGENLHVDSSDGCCKICDRKCWGVGCPTVNCTEESYKYEPDSCCPICGCVTPPLPPPEDYIGHPCDRCRRKKNGDIVCRRPECPAVKLECVDPDYDECCNYICPQGKTCKQGDYVIKYGEFKIVKNKVCTCVGDWYPRAFCNQKMGIAAMERLEKTRCVEDATIFSAWERIEALYAANATTSSDDPPPLL